MRPYLTVILDSFHEAFASRVLYILLLVLTLVLAALAPLGYVEQRMLRFDRMSIRDMPDLVLEIRTQAAADEPSPGKRVFELATPALKEIVQPAGMQSVDASPLSPSQVEELVDGLNQLLSLPDLYQPEAWHGIQLNQTTQDLLSEGVENLPQDELLYLNRLLLYQAFPVHLAGLRAKELYLTYALWTLPEPVPGSTEFFPVLVKTVLAVFMDIFVGTIAIFVAILVTAPIIPRTFEPGAIDLLLSKPISRSFLLIAKYVGGCAFILLNATYFIVGLWLIVGLRLDVWSEKLLLCIPIFLFQFAIYYAVSTFAGVLWRNAVVSIVVTVLFFLACFSVGTAKDSIEQAFINPNRLVRLVPTTDSMVGVTQAGQFVQWNRSQAIWEEVLQVDGARRRGPEGLAMQSILVGPVYHEPTQTLLYLQRPTGTSRRTLGSGTQFWVAKWTGNWVATSGPSPPAGASWILQDADQQVFMVASSGIFGYDIDAASKQKNTKILGLNIPLGRQEAFERVGPDAGVPYFPPFAAAMEVASGRIVVENQGGLDLLARDEEGKYEVRLSVEHRFQGAAVLGMTPQRVIVAHEEGMVEIRDVKDLSVLHEFRPAGATKPAAVECSADGRHIGVLFHTGAVWLYDDETGEGKQIDSDASAIAFQQGHFLVADAKTRVRVWKIATNEVVETYQPAPDTLRWYYDWLIQPLYFVFPKPGELSALVHYLLTDDATSAFSFRESGDLREVRVAEDLTTPVVHGVIFVTAMLVVTCLYVRRLDL